MQENAALIKSLLTKEYIWKIFKKSKDPLYVLQNFIYSTPSATITFLINGTPASF